jgi:hydroxyacylglutathione hydrolase
MNKWKTKSGYEITEVLSGRSNVFLLTNGKTNILIDTSPEYRWKLLEKRLGILKVRSIDYLILTHTHGDHAQNSRRIKDKYKSKVIVHKNEASFLSSGRNPVPEGTTFVSRIIINSFTKKVYSRLRYEQCEIDILADSFLDLRDFGFNAFIMHTPGHSVGSMSIIVDNEVALVGDAMFGIFKWSVFPPFADNIDQMITSWGKLLETGCSVFIPSHGSANSRTLVQKDYLRRI